MTIEPRVAGQRAGEQLPCFDVCWNLVVGAEQVMLGTPGAISAAAAAHMQRSYRRGHKVVQQAVHQN